MAHGREVINAPMPGNLANIILARNEFSLNNPGAESMTTKITEIAWI